MKRFLYCSAALALGGWLSMTNPVQAQVAVGDPAPKFELKGSDGKTYKLSDFQDKQAIVIAWYPKAFTGG